MTARVIGDLNADILAIVEAEDRPALRRFNDELLARRYAHVMLVDGNDERGIDVGSRSPRSAPRSTPSTHMFRDVLLDGQAAVHLHGKGRKQRAIPLWNMASCLTLCLDDDPAVFGPEFVSQTGDVDT